MSDIDSSSTDSDDNNPFFGMPLVPLHYPEHLDSPAIVSSSESDIDQFHHFGTSSSDEDVLLHHSSEETDSNLSYLSSATSNLFVPCIREMSGHNSNKTVQKHNHWSITKELYKREIGCYNHGSKFSTKFYQSLVAVQKLKLSKQLKGHEGCVNSLDFNAAGNLIASGSDDYKICLWDWSKGKCVLKYNTAHTRNIFQTKFLTSQGDIRIVSSGRDGLVMLTAVSNSCDITYSKVIARHDRSCNKLAIHQDQPYMVLSCGEDGIVKNIDIRESPINENERSTNILRITNELGSIIHLYGIDINPMNSMEFIVNGDDESVRMYDKRRLSNTLKQFCRQSSSRPTSSANDNNDDSGSDDILESFSLRLGPNFPESHITSAVFNYCGTEILASYSEDDIYLFDVNGSSDTHMHQYSGHLNRMTVKGVNFYGPKSDYVVSGSDCGYIYIWDKKSEAIVLRKHADGKGAVNVLEAHPHIATLATSGLDKTIKIWEPLNKWQQPNKHKLRMCIVRSRADRDRRLRLGGFDTRQGNPLVGLLGRI